MRGFAIKKSRFRKEMRERGIANPTALARVIGMNRSTTTRVLKGECLAGADFADKLCHAWQVPHDELFMSADKSRRRQAPAASAA